MDTVLLDPPLVALDKDAPVPFAGRKNKHPHTHTHRIKHLPYSPCTLKYPPTYRKYNKHTASTIVPHTSSPKSHTRIAAQDASVLCAGNCGNSTRQKQMIQQFAVLTICYGGWIPFITLSSPKQMGFLRALAFFILYLIAQKSPEQKALQITKQYAFFLDINMLFVVCFFSSD